MVVGRGLMYISHININPTVTSLDVSPSYLECDGYATFTVGVDRANGITPRPTGSVRVIDVDTGATIVGGNLDDGYYISNIQLINGVYNFVALYNGVINVFAASQSATVGYNVSFIGTTIRLTGPDTFRSDDGARYVADVSADILIAAPIFPDGVVIFTANDGYQTTILGIIPLVSGRAIIDISGGILVAGSWTITAQFISDGICYASSGTESKNVLVT